MGFQCVCDQHTYSHVWKQACALEDPYRPLLNTSRSQYARAMHGTHAWFSAIARSIPRGRRTASLDSHSWWWSCCPPWSWSCCTHVGQPAAGQPLDNPISQLPRASYWGSCGGDRHLGCFHVATVRRAANIAHLELNLAKFSTVLAYSYQKLVLNLVQWGGR